MLADELPIRIAWHPFLLDPHLPPQGAARCTYLDRRYGGLTAAMNALRHAVRAGAEDELRFRFERITRQPNIRLAQALLLAADEAGLLRPVATAVMDAFFEEGADLSDPAVLDRLATDLALPTALRHRSQDEAMQTVVREANRQALAADIDGVPAMLAPGLGSMSGAQPITVMRAFILSAIQAAA